MVIAVFCLNILLLIFAFNTNEDRNRWDVFTAEAISAVIGIYLLVSGALWMAGIYNLTTCMTVVTVIDLLLITSSYFICKRKNINIFDIKCFDVNSKWILSRIIIIVLCFFSLGSYGVFGIGRNDGNALVQAFTLRNGLYSREYTFDEYETILPESEYAEYFFNTISELDADNFTGEYRLEDKTVTNEKGEKKYVTQMIATFGYNPVYASFLELGMALFGVTRASYINVLLIFCILTFLDSILMKMKCKWSLRTALIALLGISPIVVYANHTAIVETVMMFCLVGFLYYIICKSNQMSVFGALFVVAMAFTGVSTYTLIPCLLIVCWIMYLFDRRKSALILSLLTSLGYGISYILYMMTAKTNTMIVYRQGLFFLKENQISAAVWICTGISVIIPVCLFFFYKEKALENLSVYAKVKGQVIFKLGILLLTLASIVFTILYSVNNCNKYADVTKMSLFVVATLTGVIILPLIIVGIARMNYTISTEVVVIIVMFAYGVLVYSGFARPVVDEYYFEARFLLPFIPLVILTAGIVLNKKNKETWIYPVIAVVILMIPYTANLFGNKADEKLEWENMKNVIQVVKDNSDENTIVLLDRDLMKDYYIALESIDGIKVYPYAQNVKGKIAKSVDIFGKKVLYITYSKKNKFLKNGKLLYSKYNICSKVDKGDCSRILSLPLEYTTFAEDMIQVVEIPEYAKVINSIDCEDGRFSLDEIELKIQDVSIKDEVATITVSFTDNREVLYFNPSRMNFSYHLSFNDKEKNVFENPRWKIGSARCVNGFPQSFRIYLNEIDEEDVTVSLDVAEETVEWYSTKHSQCPAVKFTKGEDGWSYAILQYKQ